MRTFSTIGTTGNTERDYSVQSLQPTGRNVPSGITVSGINPATVQPGQECEIVYPAPLARVIPARMGVNWSKNDFQIRHIKIIKIRDLATSPITMADYLRRPLLHRSRFLALAWDYSARGYRQFYLHNIGQDRPAALVRSNYLQVSAMGGDLISNRQFAVTRRDRIVLARFLISITQSHPTLAEVLRVGCPALRVYRPDLPNPSQRPEKISA